MRNAVQFDDLDHRHYCQCDQDCPHDGGALGLKQPRYTRYSRRRYSIVPRNPGPIDRRMLPYVQAQCTGTMDKPCFKVATAMGTAKQRVLIHGLQSPALDFVSSDVCIFVTRTTFNHLTILAGTLLG